MVEPFKRMGAATCGESCYSRENSHCGGRLQNEAVHLVCLVYLVYLVCLVCLLNQTDQIIEIDHGSKEQGHSTFSDRPGPFGSSIPAGATASSVRKQLSGGKTDTFLPLKYLPFRGNSSCWVSSV